MKKDAFSDILQTACSFASEIISFIPDPESGKAGKTPPTHPPTSTPKPNAGQAANFIYTCSGSVYCKLLIDLKGSGDKEDECFNSPRRSKIKKVFLLLDVALRLTFNSLCFQLLKFGLNALLTNETLS